MTVDIPSFQKAMQAGYGFEEPALVLGGAMVNGTAVPETHVRLPLKMLNRHGLIAGATGSGKTKTLQILAEELSLVGVPSLLMDIKGDLSGIAQPAQPHPKIDERMAKIGLPFEPWGAPVELLSLSDQAGVPLRATVTEFGPILFSKMLQLNETQSGIVSLAFMFCDDRKLPLVDLKDFRSVINHLTGEGKETVEQDYGAVSTTSARTILRKMLQLEQQGGDRFFGQPSFNTEDLCGMDARGQGMVSVLRLTDIQDKPKLFSTFMLSLLAEIYATFPEQGDADRPRLAVFIDEAHLVFEEASSELLDQLESIIKLIRSKGVGIYFCTQNPSDIPEEILGQLGLKIQHALRAFTAKDRRSIKQTAENYPLSEFYDTATLLTELGIGEALVTALGPKGRPTPLAHTLLRAPRSRMDILSGKEIKACVDASPLMAKYAARIDNPGAYEALQKKMSATCKASEWQNINAKTDAALEEALGTAPPPVTRKRPSRSRKSEKNPVVEMLNGPLARQVGRTLAREVSRSLLGALGVKRR